MQMHAIALLAVTIGEMQHGGHAAVTAPTTRIHLSRPALAGGTVDQVSMSWSDEDLIAEMNGSGLGTLDVMMRSGPPPDVTVRVFNGSGGAGTTGLTEEMLTPREALGKDEWAMLATPLGLRLNIGVRTLESGAKLRIAVLDSIGSLLWTAERTYPPEFFTQTSVQDFTGGVPPVNAQIVIMMLEGSAFVYGAATDNRTNDPSIRFVKRR